jgi:hypothetical protein
MDTTSLQTKFARMGSRLKFVERTNRRGRSSAAFSLDVQSDRLGEFFEVDCPPGVAGDVSVLDVQPADRHLLLLVCEGEQKSKFLCGHDERHWFVAGIPESAPVGTVRQAKEALKPLEVRRAQDQQGLRSGKRNRRKTSVSIRQGEWFFVPVPNFIVNEKLVLRNEPLSRGVGSKPHWTEFSYRTGGETVYVCAKYPAGVSPKTYERLIATQAAAKTWKWRPMRRNPGVYVRGRIRHADHKTITLNGWHRVLMNTENQSQAMRHVAFLD